MTNIRFGSLVRQNSKLKAKNHYTKYPKEVVFDKLT